MSHDDSNRSLLDRVPFAIRVLIAGALTLSTLFLSAAAGVMLFAYSAGSTPGRHPMLAHPARVVAGAVQFLARETPARGSARLRHERYFLSCGFAAVAHAQEVDALREAARMPGELLRLAGRD